jgi:hypothetical protein
MNKPFDIDIEMTGRVSTTVALNIIVAAVERQTGRQVADIRVRYDGDRFAGFDVTFDPKLHTHHDFKPSKEFIVNNFNEN